MTTKAPKFTPITGEAALAMRQKAGLNQSRFWSVVGVGQAAAALHVRPQTLRAALCRDGHYFGVRPIKLRNRFLVWKAEDIERLLNGEEAAS